MSADHHAEPADGGAADGLLRAWSRSIAHPVGELALIDALVTLAPIGLALLDEQMRYLRVNRRLAALNELPTEAHVGRHVREIQPAVAELLEPIHRRVLQLHEAVTDVEISTADVAGREPARWWRLSCFPVVVPDRRVPCVGVVVDDITGRKRAELALFESQTRLRLLNSVASGVGASMPVARVIAHTLDELHAAFPALRVGYGTIDPQGRATVLGRREPPGLEAAVGPPLDPLAAPDYLATLRAGRKVVARDVCDTPLLAPLASWLLGGRVRALCQVPLPHSEVLLGVLSLDAPQPHAWSDHELATLREVADLLAVCLREAHSVEECRRVEAERQTIERKMVEAQQSQTVGVLAGGVVHDFSNLLSIVVGNAGIARLLLDGSSPAHESLDRIETAARQAASLTRQLLMPSGYTPGAVQPNDVNVLVVETANLLRGSLAASVDLRCVLAEGLPWVQADATQLRQVVMNLVINAAESLAGDRGTVTISTSAGQVAPAELAAAQHGADRPPGHYVILDVTDSGCGMDGATLSRIFDPFFTTKVSGRGLGLAAVLSIVRGHGGAISVASTPGEGTSFRVLLPAVA